MKIRFNLLVCLVLALMASITSVKADVYYHVEMVPVLENGATGLVYACPYASANTKYYNYLYNMGKEGKWTTHFEGTFSKSSGNPDFYIMAYPGDDKRSIFAGWYCDEACTVPLKDSPTTHTYAYCKLNVSGSTFGNLSLSAYASAAIAEQPANVIKIYARFVKAAPDFDWSTKRATPTSGEKYYVYSPVRGCFLKAPKGTASSTNMPTMTANPSEATLFTYTSVGTYDGTKNTNYDDYGVKENRSYKGVRLTYLDGTTTKYASCSSYSYWTSTSSPGINHTLHLWSWASMDEKTYVIAKADASSYEYVFNILEALYIPMNGSNTSDVELSSSTGGLKHVGGIYWMFIPESAFMDVAEVSDVNENGSVTITSSPTGTGTAYVKFNVSSGSIPAAFNYELSGADASHWALGTATCADGVLTVPVTYTAQNRHSGTSTPASTVTVTVTAQNEGATTASGTASAYTDFEPRFALNVNTLDWSRVGVEVVETYYSGQEIAASQRDRLANKLVKDDAQTTGVAGSNATWTATIIGTNADQFKFANGTQTVEGKYTASLLDVRYAPTTTGNHEATLHIVTSYKDASNHTETYERDITLRGIGSAASRITFAKAGNQLPTNAETHNFGEIIGTNQQDITADLFISQITNPQMVWDDPAGQFVFVNQASVDLTQLNQTLSFRAKRTSPVEANTVHTATLTVSGKGTANEDVSATITLTYTALPLIQTTVTWNWATIKENATVTNPITTNSDGVWTLEKSVGDKITYNSASKTATAAYLHHEPGITAEFVLHIPQTDTYTAFDAEYEAVIDATRPENVYIDEQSDLGNGVDGPYGKVSKWSSSWEIWYDDTKTLQVGGDKIWFYFDGQNTFEFDFLHTTTSSYSMKWYLDEYDANGTKINTIWNTSFIPTNGHYVISISPLTTKVEMKGTGKLSNIHFYDYDTIAANYNQVALVYDNGNISSLDVSTTFANKRQVTASLNATAAQYFEIRSTGKATGSSMVFDSNDGLGLGLVQDKVFTIALKSGANADAARAATAGNACQLIFADDYTYNHEVLSLPILVIEPCEITYKHSANGSYTVTYQSDEVAHIVDNTDFSPSITTAEPSDYVVTLSAPTSASGYQFQGWKVNDVIVSCRETFTTSIGVDGSVIEAVFVPAEPQNFKVGDVYFADLGAALSTANISADSKVVTLMQENLTLGDGENTFTYTIPVGVTLLIPHKADFFELQETPDLVNVNSEALENAQKLSAYRTLTLKEGVNIICNGTICVAGNMVTANGGRKSAYPTGEVGMINMVHGGHIELNNGANLYCWGYIKGQDMDQGNNTVGTGTVTANAGSVVWENFELGDWRGGSASLDIYNNNVIDHRKLFPFQSYAIQNVEVPTTFKFGSYLKNYTSITTGFGNHGAVFSMIGPSETMFLLTDEDSKVRTWYDPTTDLSCYELSGTAQLDALHITVYVSMSSEDFILPICNSMHIILDSCDMTLANPLMVQAGAIIEIKKAATVNLTSELYLYDKDQWGKYAHNYYFRSFNNITSHKNRGAEDSNAGLDDAKFIIDGIFNINAGGKLYATKGGANVMGNGGGVINFNTALPDSIKLYAVEVASQLPYITWVWNRAYAANLCNEDGSYTRSNEGYTFYNINGRWFDEDDKDILENQTYNFRYINGNNPEEDIVTNAVYSHDKTGLEARMKWFNVEADENCENWWIGSNPAAQYNYTMLNDWHQFIATETENVYSGSDNKLYQKDGCTWIEEGAVDENCLYTIGGVKKALVNGEFIALTPNGYDPAYHNGDQYYICFSGCNWHEATKLDDYQKAYKVELDTFIWYNNAWMAVEFEAPFFYTFDEKTNVKINYEYINGEWVVATPYVSVSDPLIDIDPRPFFDIHEAFRVASIKKNATITILRDISNITESCVFETQNTTCTLDLNGHTVSGTVNKLVNINAPGSTFTIKSSVPGGVLRMTGKPNNTCYYNVYITAGNLVLEDNATIEVDNADAYVGDSYALCAVRVPASTTFTMYGGAISARVDRRAYGIESNGTTTLEAGTITCQTLSKAYPYGVQVKAGSTTIKSGVTITCTAGTTYAHPVIQTAGTLTVTGGTFRSYAVSNSSSYHSSAIRVDAGTANISGATLYAEATGTGATSKDAYGIYSKGTTTLTNCVASAKTKTNKAYGVCVAGGTTTIVSGCYKGSAPSSEAGVYKSAGTLMIQGGYYSHNTNLSSNLAANRGAFATNDAEKAQYGADVNYKVLEAYTITFMNGENQLQSSVQEKGIVPSYTGSEPTKEPTELETYAFDGWSLTNDGDLLPTLPVVTDAATYYAHFTTIGGKYKVTFDATTNGGTSDIKNIYIEEGSAVGTLPVATKVGHTFNGWFTESTGGEQISAATIPAGHVTYYAQFTINSYTLTWNLEGGKVSTAGTAAAKDATGTCSDEIPYGTGITVPVVARTGYTFVDWGSTPASTMPAANLEYTASWTPNANTNYKVLHKKQNPENLEEYLTDVTENLTGTTGAYVAPKPKVYVGYETPDEVAPVQILADGSLEIVYLYNLITYTVHWKANGGSCATESTQVKYGATLTLAEATWENHTFDGWFTKAVGGDQITASTVILHNIDTLYAHWTETAVIDPNDIVADGTAPVVISEGITANSLTVEEEGVVKILDGASLTVETFILESNTNESGQVVGAPRLNVNGKAYFDVQFKGDAGTANRTWYAIAVPWEVDAENGILWKEGDRKLVLGRDFDLVWYDGEERAAHGDGYACWKYLENESDKMMHPGKMYMMYFGSQFQTVRFEKHAGKPIVYTGDANAVTSVSTYDLGTGNATDDDWNGIANPSLCHAYLNAGVSYGQVLNNGSLDDYQVNHPEGNPVYRTKALNTYKFVVGKPVFVQATANQPITLNPAISGAFAAPARERAENMPEGIDAVFAVTIVTETNHEADNLFIQVTEDEKADTYVIGQDLAKGGVAKTIPQLWINRYNAKLSVNTQALTNDAAEYPLTLFAPQAGDYQISNVQSQMSNEDYTLYLTLNGQAIWNLSNSDYTFSLPQGNTTEYGLRVSAHTPQITTGIDEAIVDANGETQKVIINNQVFIIREGQLYTVDGRKVK